MFRTLLILFALSGRFRPDATDEELLEQYSSDGDLQIVGELYKRHSHLALGVCIKYLRSPTLAEDAVMDIFEKLIIDLKQKQVDNFRAWLYTVCKNHCLMQLRKQQTDSTRSDQYQELMLSIMENEATLHHTIEDAKEMQLQLLEKAITELNQEQRKCIDLFYLQKKSYKEVEQITGYSDSKVKSYIQNGKRNLKQIMERSIK